MLLPAVGPDLGCGAPGKGAWALEWVGEALGVVKVIYMCSD